MAHWTRPHSAVGSEYNCRSIDHEFDLGLVPYWCGNWPWNNFFGHSPPSFDWRRLAKVQYTKRGFTIFHVGFGVATLCLAQSRWFHGDGHREFQVNQRDSQRDEERGVIIDFREWDVLLRHRVCSCQGEKYRVCTCQSEKFMTYCLPLPFLRLVARYSLPHMLKSLHRLAIATIMDSTNEEWMMKILMLN